jgi:hypothetical protein
MIDRLRIRWAFAASLLLVAAFGVGLAAEFAHTDDGCEVEVHCLACQRVLGSVGTLTLALLAAPSPVATARIRPPDVVTIAAFESLPAASRAPPLD